MNKFISVVASAKETKAEYFLLEHTHDDDVELKGHIVASVRSGPKGAPTYSGYESYDDVIDLYVTTTGTIVVHMYELNNRFAPARKEQVRIEAVETVEDLKQAAGYGRLAKELYKRIGAPATATVA